LTGKSGLTALTQGVILVWCARMDHIQRRCIETIWIPMNMH